MDQLVQSALDAANRGDKNKLSQTIQQALTSDLNDIDSLLALASLTDESTKKRQLLNRVLSLDATNKAARETILEMDRAELASYHSHSTPAPASGEPSHASQSYRAQEPASIPSGKTKVFRYSKTWLVVLSVFATLSCCATLWFASIKITHPTSLPFLIMALILGLTALTISARIEVNDAGICMYAMPGSTEMNWNEIASIKWEPLRRNLELRSDIGELITISSQIIGYRTIVEILQQKRPDLFSQSVFVADTKAPPLTESQPSVPYTVTIREAQPVPVSEPIAHLTPSDPPASKTVSEKPMVFRPSSTWQIMFFILLAFSCLTSFLVASQNISGSLPYFMLALLFGLAALSNTSKVEVRNEDIRTSSLFGSAEIRWNEIAEMKPNTFTRKLKLLSKNGKSVNIPTQVKGYPVIIEILRQKRPDLFAPGSSAPVGENHPTDVVEHSASKLSGISVPATELTSTRTFQKSFLKQYGIFLWLTPICLLLAWFGITVTEASLRLASFISIVFCALVLLLPFFQVSAVKVEPNKLTIETFFEVKELSANQIKEIKMQSREGRYGRVTTTVNIIPMEGKKYPLGGFSEGEEVLYGYLMNWWNTYQTKATG